MSDLPDYPWEHPQESDYAEARAMSNIFNPDNLIKRLNDCADNPWVEGEAFVPIVREAAAALSLANGTIKTNIEFLDSAGDRIAELEAMADVKATIAETEKLVVRMKAEARAAVLAEREACAEIADRYPLSTVGLDIAAVIRARPAP
jgi:hypothetical protein